MRSSPDQPVPIVTGASGLTGRPQVRPVYEPEELRDGPAPAVGPSIPAPCLRRLHSLNPGILCRGDCPGLQRDGGCLSDLVRATNAAGAEWAFKLDLDGYWVLTGEK